MRVRRKAARRGYVVTKSRTRDPLAIGYGSWTASDGESDWHFGSAAELETWLDTPATEDGED